MKRSALDDELEVTTPASLASRVPTGITPSSLPAALVPRRTVIQRLAPPPTPSATVRPPRMHYVINSGDAASNDAGAGHCGSHCVPEARDRAVGDSGKLMKTTRRASVFGDEFPVGAAQADRSGFCSAQLCGGDLLARSGRFLWIIQRRDIWFVASSLQSGEANMAVPCLFLQAGRTLRRSGTSARRSYQAYRLAHHQRWQVRYRPAHQHAQSSWLRPSKPAATLRYCIGALCGSVSCRGHL